MQQTAERIRFIISSKSKLRLPTLDADAADVEIWIDSLCFSNEVVRWDVFTLSSRHLAFPRNPRPLTNSSAPSALGINAMPLDRLVPQNALCFLQP